jgi:hypothetical protein
MCIAPLTLPDGVEVACHECWQCRERAINDWVGRNIAESKTAVASYAVTLTYGRSRAGDADHERAVILTYSDVQKYLKLLRRHRYSVRYFVTGEFGGLKGRTHWHIVLHFGPRLPLLKRGRVVPGADMNPVPPHVLGRIFMHERLDANGKPARDGKDGPALWWPHGWSHWTEGTSPANIRYNCKYILKDVDDAERQGHLAMSKKPPLGAAYFEQLAERYVQQGLAPQTLEYTFPEVRRTKENGTEEIVPFMLKERSAELFLEHYVRTWRAVHPGRHIPASEVVEEFLDPGAYSDKGREERASALRLREKTPDVAKPRVGDLYSWMSTASVLWDKRLRAWVAPGPGSGSRMKWCFIETKGAYGWRKIRQSEVVEA